MIISPEKLAEIKALTCPCCGGPSLCLTPEIVATMRPAPAVVMTPVSMGYMDKVQMLSRITRPMPKGNNYTHYHRARKYKRKADRAWLAGRNADSERLHAKAAHYRKLASITKIVKMLRGPTRFVRSAGLNAVLDPERVVGVVSDHCTS